MWLLQWHVRPVPAAIPGTTGAEIIRVGLGWLEIPTDVASGVASSDLHLGCSDLRERERRPPCPLGPRTSAPV